MAELQVSQSNQNNCNYGYLRKGAQFNSAKAKLFLYSENILSIQTAAKYDK